MHIGKRIQRCYLLTWAMLYCSTFVTSINTCSFITYSKKNTLSHTAPAK